MHSFTENLGTRPSKLCKNLILNFGTLGNFVVDFFFFMETLWSKIFGEKTFGKFFLLKKVGGKYKVDWGLIDWGTRVDWQGTS